MTLSIYYIHMALPWQNWFNVHEFQVQCSTTIMFQSALLFSNMGQH